MEIDRRSEISRSAQCCQLVTFSKFWFLYSLTDIRVTARRHMWFQQVRTPSHYATVYETIWTGYFETRGLDVMIPQFDLWYTTIYLIDIFSLRCHEKIYIRHALQFWNEPGCTNSYRCCNDTWNARYFQTRPPIHFASVPCVMLVNGYNFKHLMSCFYVIFFLLFFCAIRHFTLHSVLWLYCPCLSLSC